MARKFDYECVVCGTHFEGEPAPGHTVDWAWCPYCPKRDVGGPTGKRQFKPGSWTTGRVASFSPHFNRSLGERFTSQRQHQNRLAVLREQGIVPAGTTPRRERRTVTFDQAGQTLRDLTRAEVLRHREGRERAEWEARNGPWPGAPSGAPPPKRPGAPG